MYPNKQVMGLHTGDSLSGRVSYHAFKALDESPDNLDALWLKTVLLVENEMTRWFNQCWKSIRFLFQSAFKSTVKCLL